MIRASALTVLGFCVAAFAAAPAAAQTTTYCSPIGGGVSCSTSADPWAGQQASQQQLVQGAAALGANIRARRDAKALQQRKVADAALIRQYMDAGECEAAVGVAAPYSDAAQIQSVIRSRCTPKQTADQLLLAQIGQAVQGGRCEEAKGMALTAGRLDVAEQAMRLCVPAAAQPPVQP